MHGRCECTSPLQQEITMHMLRSRLLKWAAASAAAAGALLAATSASADIAWSVGVNVLPGVVVTAGSAQPYYYAPSPIYVRPAPVFVPPAPMYRPAPVYYAPPPPPRVYYRPVPVFRPAPHYRGQGHRR
jgi:hypothetical protein